MRSRPLEKVKAGQECLDISALEYWTLDTRRWLSEHQRQRVPIGAQNLFRILRCDGFVVIGPDPHSFGGANRVASSCRLLVTRTRQRQNSFSPARFRQPA